MHGAWHLGSTAAFLSSSYKVQCLRSLWQPGAPQHGLGTTGLGIRGSAEPGPRSPRSSFDHISSQKSLHAFTSAPVLTVTHPISIDLNLLDLGVSANASFSRKSETDRPLHSVGSYDAFLKGQILYLIVCGLFGSQKTGG